MRKGIEYLGSAGSPAVNADGVWITGQVRLIGKEANDVDPDRAAEYVAEGGFKFVDVAPKAEVAPASGVSLQLMITEEMRKRLRLKGRSDADIDKMTPAEAAAVLDS